MNIDSKYLVVDNPNIPVLCPQKESHISFGEAIDASHLTRTIDPSLASVKLTDMYLPDVSLRTIEGKFSTDTLFYNQYGLGTDLMGSCIFLKGNIRSFLPGQRPWIQSFNRSHNFKFDPNNDFMHMTAADSEVHFIHVSYSGEFLSQLLPDGESWADVMRNKIVKRERIIGNDFAPISMAQEQALRNILQCPIQGKLGQMLVETSVIQLLVLQMHMLFNSVSSAFEGVQKRDLEVVNALKDFLARTFLDDHTLQGLAREFGMNANKLMGVFRRVFNQSIFEFIADLRMEHAMKLLRDEDKLVTQVASVVGYKNPNHFSAAFKRRFGICPSAV